MGSTRGGFHLLKLKKTVNILHSFDPSHLLVPCIPCGTKRLLEGIGDFKASFKCQNGFIGFLCKGCLNR